jgi:hypothetical protein
LEVETPLDCAPKQGPSSGIADDIWEPSWHQKLGNVVPDRQPKLLLVGVKVNPGQNNLQKRAVNTGLSTSDLQFFKLVKWLPSCPAASSVPTLLNSCCL